MNDTSIQRSTGPRTALGKVRSSNNSLVHGAWAKPGVLLKGESKTEHRRFVEDIVASFAPANFLEQELAEAIAHLLWKNRRVAKAETALCAESRTVNKRLNAVSDQPPLTEKELDVLSLIPREAYGEKIQRLETHLSKMIDRAMDRLARVQAQRGGQVTVVMQLRGEQTRNCETNARRRIDPTVTE